ncbi:MAG: hypothetical protein AAFZ52_07295 [Bacteroidota bacterium]
MNEPKLPFEDAWRDTLTDHEPQPKAGDWAGMEKLLRQDASPARSRIIEDPLNPTGQRPTPSLPSWWVILALLVAGLVYFFLSQLDEESHQLHSEQSFPLIVPEESVPVFRYDTLYLVDETGALTSQIFAIDTAVQYVTPTPTLLPIPDTSVTVPIDSADLPKSYRLDQKLILDPLPTLRTRFLPTDAILLERRMESLRQSGRLNIQLVPNNGYFPRYREGF